MKSVRDPRLDFFRGSAMFIIFIAHCRGNFLWDYIPARFGLSDAADMFVFLSGVAASIAFGGTFARLGWVAGAARILLRCVQLYVGHIGLFLVVAALALTATRLTGTDYVDVLGLAGFFGDAAGTLLALLGLSYVPHYFDILPLYIIVLAMVPAAVLLARVRPWLVPAVSIALYLAANAFGWNLVADETDGREWYFNPLAWQLIFFTGFALGRGWVKAPPDTRPLAGIAALYLALGVAVTVPAIYGNIDAFDALRMWVMAHSDKTYLDLPQYLHFLAEAYLAVWLLRGREQVLMAPVLRPLVKCGQQALSVFVSGMVLSHLGGMVFDQLGTGAVMQIAVNVVVFGALIAIAYTVAWFKAPPWKRAAAAPPTRPEKPVPALAPLPIEARSAA